MHAVLKLLVKAIVLGLLITFVTGFLANRFADSSSVKASMDLSDLLAPGENILFATGANHFKKGEGVGGKIYITDRNVVFRSHNTIFKSTASSCREMISKKRAQLNVGNYPQWPSPGSAKRNNRKVCGS